MARISLDPPKTLSYSALGLTAQGFRDSCEIPVADSVTGQ